MRRASLAFVLLAAACNTPLHFEVLDATTPGDVVIPLQLERNRPFLEAEANPLEAVAIDRMLPIADAAARAIGSIELTEEGVIRARHGKRLAREHVQADPPSGPRAWLFHGQLVAVGEFIEGEGRVLRGFRETSSSG